MKMQVGSEKKIDISFVNIMKKLRKKTWRSNCIQIQLIGTLPTIS